MKSSEEREHNLQKLKNRSKKKVSVDSDSGYCSMMESGYSSNRDSASQSFIVYYYFIIFLTIWLGPNPSLSLVEDSDVRERIWLMCQAGILPARIVDDKVNKKKDNDEEMINWS